MIEIDPNLQAVFDWIDTHREEAIADGIPAEDFDAIVVPSKMIGPDPA